MHRFFTFILAAVVLVHATFGCCIHHAHSCEVDCCDSPAATAAACPCDGHNHEEESGAGSWELARHSGHDNDSHRCEAEQCTLVAPEPSDNDLDDTFSTVTAFACLVVGADVTLVSNKPEHGKPPGVVSAAPRLHLVLSVLLI
ncbi:MAG: hypothetical protein H6822_02190 [Planctomycetaceae bacterium]|nr:hypothetical protein [Planctomycetales bacterium]MCB9920960.1 hypothetical protein [Planctomycetaceae bacterium]